MSGSTQRSEPVERARHVTGPKPPRALSVLLPAAALRQPEELREFERSVELLVREAGGVYEAEPDRWVRDPAASAAASLAIALVEVEALSAVDAAFVVVDAAGDLSGDSATPPLSNLVSDSLRVAAAVAPHIAKEPEDWTSLVVGAVTGLRGDDLSGPCLVATERDLAEHAAVARFVVVDSKHRHWGSKRTAAPHLMFSVRIENPHLEALIRERPEDVDRITAYCSERGIDPDSRGAVDFLREWLSTPAAAVADGWL